MKKNWFWIVPGAALLAILLVALPGPAARDVRQEQRRAEASARAEKARLQAEGSRIKADADAETRKIKAEVAAEAAAEQAVLAEDLAALHEEVEQEMAHARGQHGVHVFSFDEDDRGWLGVTISEVTAEKAKELKLPAERGALLSEVEADSPAAKGGLKAGDVITEFNGQKVEGTAQFRRFIRETPAGRTVQLTYWRDGGSQTASVQLGPARSMFEVGPKDFNFNFQMPQLDRLRVMPELKMFSFGRPLLGIDAEDLTGQLGGYFGAPEGEGVLVRTVNVGSPAEKAGLKAGDVITQVNGERVKTVSDLREKMRASAEKKTVALGVLRNRAQVTVNVEIEQPKPMERKRLVSRRVLL